MTASADFELSSDDGATYAASNVSLADAAMLAYVASGTYSCKARLTSTADVVSVGWSITTADDEHLASLPTVTANADKTCSFPIPKTGGAWIVKATVTDGAGVVRTNTLAVKVAPSTGKELIAAGEGVETGAAGWVRPFNDLARTVFSAPTAPTVTAPIWFPLTNAAGSVSLTNAGSGTAFLLDTITGSVVFETATPTGNGMFVLNSSFFEGVGTAKTYEPTTEDFTIHVWVKFMKATTLGGAGEKVLLFGKESATGASYAIGVAQDDGKLQAYIDTSSGGPQVYEGGFVDTGWNHLAITYDGANVVNYINAIPVATNAKTGTIVYDVTKSHLVGNNADNGLYTMKGLAMLSSAMTQADLKAMFRQGAYGT